MSGTSRESSLCSEEAVESDEGGDQKERYSDAWRSIAEVISAGAHLLSAAEAAPLVARPEVARPVPAARPDDPRLRLN